MLDKVFILVGISPLKSLKLARYLNDKIPGITIPDAIMQRLADAGDKVAEEGVKITVEAIRKLRGKKGISGVHIMPLGWEASVPYILKEVL